MRSKEIAMRTSSSVTINSSDRESGLPANPDRTALIISIVVGAAIGVGLGFFSMAGGWLAPIIGFLLGALAGGIVGKLTLARQHRQAARDRVLDREIGTIP
jgi:membrane associated rhomboid family serine protease